ncbi:methyltransferase [Kribbella sp. NPDC049227]|uniref:methyltransferase n=1 Tax=Kribbella sp. NPDC049227 TaxID=3364113 RepID=UPI0037191262
MIPSALESAMFGVVSTPILNLADKYGMFSYLIDKGPSRAAQAAFALKVDAETLERMLLALTAFGILDRTGEGRYGLKTNMRPYLDPADEHYIGGFVDHLINETSDQITRLSAYLEHGKADVDKNLPSPFETFYRNPHALAEFMTAMWSLSYAPSKELAVLADLDHVGTVVDVGGASGPFSVAALQHYPDLRATVFDLPQVGDFVQQTRATYDLADRLDFVPGDFFADELPSGEAIAFGYVLSDWTDASCAQLLTNAYRACQASGRVLIMERLFDDTRNGPLATSVMNLTMHVETQGRHRTAHEYLSMLQHAGFSDCAVHRSSGDKHLIIGHKR